MILSASDSKLALQAVRDIGQELEINQDQGLLGGNAGKALFMHHLDEMIPSAYYKDKKKDLNLAVAALLEDKIANFDLSQGYSGMLWSLRANGYQVSPSLQEFYQQVTEYYLDSKKWTGEYELVYGLCGIGINLIDGISETGARSNAHLLLQKIQDASKDLPHGKSWFTPAKKVVNVKKASIGQYNLGVAHGIPALWVTLARLYQNNIGKRLCRNLFNENFKWLEEVSARHPAGLPSHIDRSTKVHSRARLAWCYGDPGAGLALLLASDLFGHDRAKEMALQILLRSTKVARDESDIHDAGLCHGSGGLAMIYLTAYKITKEKQLKNAATFWFKETLNYKKTRRAGVFQSFEFIPQEGQFKYIKAEGLLTGTAGVGLALLSALSDEELYWGRPLLMTQ